LTAAVVGYSLLHKAAGLKTLNFLPAQFRALSFPGGDPVIGIDLPVQNITNQDFTIRGMSGNLYSGGTYLGNISTFNAQVIEPTSETELHLDFELNFNGAVTQIIEAITENNFTKTIDMKMKVNVDGLIVDVNQSMKVGL
jgi:LEA14-like dessication related protein